LVHVVVDFNFEEVDDGGTCSGQSLIFVMGRWYRWVSLFLFAVYPRVFDLSVYVFFWQGSGFTTWFDLMISEFHFSLSLHPFRFLLLSLVRPLPFSFVERLLLFGWVL
jgi:hypothetical protein